MTDIPRSLFRNGISCLTTRNGLVLMSGYLLITLLLTGLTSVASSSYLPLQTDSALIATSNAQTFSPTVEVPLIVSLSATFITLGLTTAITTPIQIVAIRTFASDYDNYIPDRFLFHRMGWATAHSYLAIWLTMCIVTFVLLLSVILGIGLVYLLGTATMATLTNSVIGIGVAVIGGILLLTPAIILLTGLIFVAHEIAIRDRNIFRACIGSWKLASPNLLFLALLSTGFIITLCVVSVVVPILAPPLISDVGLIVLSTVITFLYLSVSTRIYCQILNTDLSHQPVFGQ